MALIEEAPREWSALCADALAVIEDRRPLPSALTGEGGPWLAWEATRLDRLARQVAELAQRLAGDTETLEDERTRPHDYTDDEHPAVRLRLYTEDGPEGREWWIDGISADGTRCSESVWEYDSFSDAVANLATFAAAHVPQLVTP